MRFALTEGLSEECKDFMNVAAQSVRDFAKSEQGVEYETIEINRNELYEQISEIKLSFRIYLQAQHASVDKLEIFNATIIGAKAAKKLKEANLDNIKIMRENITNMDIEALLKMSPKAKIHLKLL
jgi:predicted nucleotide-binding protein (sugar kinase/HSP70/actin superfamily)